MTGWRLGWVVAPEWLVEPLERLAQNLFLAAPTPAQHAALAAFSAPTLALLEQRRQRLQARRDFLAPALTALGLRLPVMGEGAFYLYADCAGLTDDSFGFAQRLLHATGVAVTPGLDFGDNAPARHLRFAYTPGIDRLPEAVERLARFIAAG
jgi:aspartate/methionine/tyrosine aminotransferase